MSITLKIDDLRGGEIAPLYNRYPGQTEAQGAYVEITEDGTVTADSDPNIGGGSTFDVFHGRTRRWNVSATVRGEVLADLLESAEVTELLGRIYVGHSVEWDGNNNVGRLDDDAAEAEQDLESLLDALGEDETACGAVWDLENWLGLLDFDDKWPKGETLVEAVKGVEDGAASSGVQLDGNIEKYLLDYAQHANESGKCYRPEVLRALVADGRHPVDEDGDDWSVAFQ